MYHGKAKFVWRNYATRKDWRKWGEQRFKGYCYYVGKKEKQSYNRWIRRSPKCPLEIKNSEWKKFHACDLYNWY